jgi:hypothetical protein
MRLLESPIADLIADSKTRLGPIGGAPPTVPTEPSAADKRAAHPLFQSTWSLQAVLANLPLSWPIEKDLPPSPKVRYRSTYRYLGPAPLLDPTTRATLSDFEIALYLIDFSPLERVLAHVYVSSQKGQVPFHPVSLFLSLVLRLEQQLSWARLAALLASPEHGAGWRRLFGFADSPTPSASGLRYFHHALGSTLFDSLGARFITLLRAHDLFPETSTYPGDPPDRGISITQDGMLHLARSRPSCPLTEEVCYQARPAAEPPTDPGQSETAPETAPETAQRPCRAKRTGQEGCRCDTPACQEQCRRASRLDPDARLIHYAGHNKRGPEAAPIPAKSSGNAAVSIMAGRSQGINVFGYRSICDRVIDDRFAVAWNLQTGLYPANTDERTIFGQRLRGLQAKYPDLKIGEWLDDAGVGYGECLNAIWNLGALRLVDIRADKGDQDPEVCRRRGYDGRGRPLCPHGYALRSNGYDQQRRRTKYLCEQACRRKPLAEGGPIEPVVGCPYLEELRPLGMIVNVGKAFADGSLRLAREIPYGSDEWKARYARRNLSESRNGQLALLGLKRMASYSLDHNARDVKLADFLINLRTFGRLVRQATGLREATGTGVP